MKQAILLVAFLALSAVSGKVLKGVNTRKLVQKLDTKCDGPICPGGCCNEVGYTCCNDGIFCAATLAECPQTKTSEKLIKMLTKDKVRQ